MPSSKRESILANIKTTMAGITVLNGYNFDMHEAKRKIINFEQENETPVNHIISLESIPEPNPNNEYTINWPIRTAIIHKVADNVDDQDYLSKRMELIHEDVIKAMLADITRGNPNFVNYTFWIRSTPMYNWDKNIGIYWIDWEIQYHHTYTAP